MKSVISINSDVGVLVVSYGSREAAIVDSLERSKHNPRIYIADKQGNPFNIRAAEETAGEHRVISGLNVDGIYEFAKELGSRINFVFPGCEGPIIDGIRDKIEGDFDIPVICPTSEYALEGSKVRQRVILDKYCREANPLSMIFDPESDTEHTKKLKRNFCEWIYDELGGVSESVIKPDKPGYGKGVGVGGEHYKTLEEAWEHFLSLCSNKSGEKQPVIVEKRIDGEEFSLMSFTDGRGIVHTPAVRDYKRAFKDDEGPNTGGMGSYKDTLNELPFMDHDDLLEAHRINERLFDHLMGEDHYVPELRGVIYTAFICARDGLKVLEINSRPGDPEWQNLAPVAEFDMVELLDQMSRGRLHSMEFAPVATVVAYAVPNAYGDPGKEFERTTPVDLSGIEELKRRYRDNLRVYPGSLELDDGNLYPKGSRTACTVGIDEDIQKAREIAYQGLESIKGGNLRFRTDIASPKHISKSVRNMRKLRNRQG